MLKAPRAPVGPIYRGKKNDFAMKFLKVSVTKPLENHQSVKQDTKILNILYLDILWHISIINVVQPSGVK